MNNEELWQQLFATKRDAEAQIERSYADRDKLVAENKRLRDALKNTLTVVRRAIEAQQETCGRSGCICTYAGMVSCSEWMEAAERSARATLGGQEDNDGG